MIFILQFLARLIAVLRSAATPAQIGGGVLLGMAIGIIPSFTLKTLLFLLLILVNVNIAIALVSMLVFGLGAYLLDPLFHLIGYAVLVKAQFLKPFWSALYNIPFVPFTGYNNTVVMGAMVVTLVLLYPVYIAVKRGVALYRKKVEPVAGNWKIVRMVQKSTFYNWYLRLRKLGDELL
ncbi:MAG: TIGR03546 family protein [Chitinispirillaceae bacterium]